jgi:uncharacterized Zn finger protein
MSGEYKNNTLKEVARLDDQGNLHCPACSGTQFEAVRSSGRKLAFGIASLLAPANQVRCVTCGEIFKR